MPDPIQGVNASDALGVAATGQTGPTQAVVPERAAIAATPKDSANVGQTEALLATIADAANAAPSIDEAKVAELQKAIAGGTYQVNPQQIAQNLLNFDAALSGSAQQ